jgi:hypothetical protein
MAQVSPVDSSFHIKKGDLNPPLRIKLWDSETGLPLDLSTYTVTFYMALASDKHTSPKINGVAANITDATNGLVEYRWAGTDTDTVEKYYYEFKFTAGGKSFRIPVNNPGVVIIESKIG